MTKTKKTTKRRKAASVIKFPANCKKWPNCSCIMRGNASRDCGYIGLLRGP